MIDIEELRGWHFGGASDDVNCGGAYAWVWSPCGSSGNRGRRTDDNLTLAALEALVRAVGDGK